MKLFVHEIKNVGLQLKTELKEKSFDSVFYFTHSLESHTFTKYIFPILF